MVQGSSPGDFKRSPEKELSPSKMIGFGSDGASVMTGENKGVKGRLKEQNAHMVDIHCMAHRLALSTSQAVPGVAYVAVLLLESFSNKGEGAT